MNQLKQLFLHPIAIILYCAALGFSIGRLIELKAGEAPNVGQFSQELEQELHQAENEIHGLFNNGSFLLNAVEGYLLGDTVKKYINKQYTFFIYDDKDSVIYWNNNKNLPFQSDIQYSRADTTERYEISASIFLRVRRPYDFLIDGVTYHYNLEALIPLYRHYSINNGYLQDYFPMGGKDFSQFVTISDEETPYVIKNRAGQDIIYIQAKDHIPYRGYFNFSLWLYLLSSLLFLIGMYSIGMLLIRKKQLLGGLLFVLGSFSAFRLLIIVSGFPDFFSEYSVFNEQLSQANTFWQYSLGDFLVDGILLLGISIFISRELRKKLFTKYTFQQQVFVTGFSYLTLVGGLGLIQFAVRDIVMASFISFEFDAFSKLDYHSFLSLIGIGFLILSFFLTTYRLFVLIDAFQLSRRIKIGLFSFSFVTVGLISSIYFLPIDSAVFLGASIIHSLTLSVFVTRKTTSLAWISIWLILFSAFSTTMLENSNMDKGIKLRKQFSKELAFERDLETERTFAQLVPDILEDGFLKISINNPLSPSPRRQAVELLTYRYLDNYFFGRYDYSVHIYTEDGRPYRGEKRSYEELVNQLRSSRKTLSKYLQFYSHPEGRYSYFAQLPIAQNGNLLGIIIIEFTPKKAFKRSNIYVELLSRNKDQLENIYAQYTYALYKYNERVLTNGAQFKAELAYDLPRPEPGKHKMLTTEGGAGNNYLVYTNQYDGNTISIVKVPKFHLFRVLTIFAYIFCFGIFLLTMVQLFNWIVQRLFKVRFLRLQFENSLRERIQRGILMVTLASFIAIAIITILYYSNEYEDYHKSRLLRKISSTARTAVWQIHESPDSIARLPEAKSLADIHKIDVNIYDIGGNLLSSSEKVIFERHLLSRKMDPIAFQRLRHEQQDLVQQLEIINNFEYLSAYMPLKDKEENTMAYLHLPYDLAGSKNIGSQDVAEFLGALLNVYVIFLLIAGGAAFFIANSVTNPLSVVASKLNEVKLGEKNEPIYWKNRDEIGELVERYNTMITALEESTIKLARSQRESAWREMAKQIAHEIKNPLTPMKLNIQLLERVVNTNPEKAQKMVHRVSNTLIEQIDSLAHIASEFSNFAKMPIANNEKLHLNELVENAYSLFKEEENVQLFLTMTDKECTVFADKTQVMRVLNNLLKNAVQAIPDDQPGIIKVELTTAPNKAVIKVSDNGCGIPDNQKDDIFVPNFTTKSSGTGIGLAMSKTIVEMAKGQVYFESEVDKGTTFFVELPLMLPVETTETEVV